MNFHFTFREKEPSPRVNKEFIGLGHELEDKKKTRKQLDQEQQFMQNRVSYIHKQKYKAHKNLTGNKKKYQQLVHVQERHQNDLRQKARLIQSRIEEEERQRRKNEQMRLMRQTRLTKAHNDLKQKNKQDYERVKRLSQQGETKLKNFKDGQVEGKKYSWLKMNVDKERGRQKVDDFYRTRNKKFVEEYQQKISLEVDKSRQKIYHINQLEEQKRRQYQKLNISTNKVNLLADKISFIANSSRVKSTNQMYQNKLNISQKYSNRQDTTSNATPKNKLEIETFNKEMKEEELQEENSQSSLKEEVQKKEMQKEINQEENMKIEEQKSNQKQSQTKKQQIEEGKSLQKQNSQLMSKNDKLRESFKSKQSLKSNKQKSQHSRENMMRQSMNSIRSKQSKKSKKSSENKESIHQSQTQKLKEDSIQEEKEEKNSENKQQLEEMDYENKQKPEENDQENKQKPEEKDQENKQQPQEIVEKQEQRQQQEEN